MALRKRDLDPDNYGTLRTRDKDGKLTVKRLGGFEEQEQAKAESEAEPEQDKAMFGQSRS